MVVRELRAHQELLQHQVRQELLQHQAHQELQVQTEHQAHQELLQLREHRVLMAQQEHQVLMAHQEHQEQQAHQELRELTARQALRGTSGTSGSSGASGATGASGSSGTSGTVGTSGTAGSSGISTGINGWVSAGTIQSVGWGATTTAPTVGSTAWNNISYWQVATKQWQVIMSFNNNGNGGGGANAGNGDYLFTLPDGLSFDTTLASQVIFTGSVQANDTNFPKYALPSGSGMVTDGQGSTSTNFVPVVYNATKFRIMAYLPNVSISCIGSNNFSTTSTVGFQLTFTFTST